MGSGGPGACVLGGLILLDVFLSGVFSANVTKHCRKKHPGEMPHVHAW